MGPSLLSVRERGRGGGRTTEVHTDTEREIRKETVFFLRPVNHDGYIREEHILSEHNKRSIYRLKLLLIIILIKHHSPT